MVTSASKSVSLVDTYNNFGLTEEDWKEYLHEEVSEDDYKDFLADNGLTEGELSFEDYCTANECVMDYYDWLEDLTELYTEDFWSNCSGIFDLKQTGFVITGSLGLWNGTPSVGKVCDGNILDAIRICVSGNSINDFSVDFKDGVIYVGAMHHDGTNSFEIRALTAKGEDWISRHDADDADDCQHLVDIKGYTKKIKVF